MIQTIDTNTRKSNRQRRLERAARERLAQQADTDTGGTLLGKHMVHKKKTGYDRNALRRKDRQGFFDQE